MDLGCAERDTLLHYPGTQRTAHAVREHFCKIITELNETWEVMDDAPSFSTQVSQPSPM